MSREHIRFLLGQTSPGATDLDVLATQLTAALDGPLLLYLSSATLAQAAPQVSERLGRGWEDLIERVCRYRGREPRTVRLIMRPEATRRPTVRAAGAPLRCPA